MVDPFRKDTYTMLDLGQKDAMTNFFLRDSLDSFLDRVITDADMTHKSLPIALVDIDHFKKFNDTYGHLMGDQVIKYIASTIRMILQDAGYIFRYGGDEFLVVFPNKDPDVALELVRRCNYSVANRPFSYKGKLMVITLSCGVACFPKDAQKREGLIKRADEALYFSKHYGRNTTTMARQIKYIRLRRTLFSALRISVLLGLVFILSTSVFKDSVRSLFKKIKNIRVITQDEQGVDCITLKSGKEVKGYIIDEDDKQISVSLDLNKGRGSLSIKKSEIVDIKRGSKDYK
ncbi:GGDEF domain-containing protein [Thermoproteota archaeon]